MQKKPVHKRHVVIKMSDLNKMFKENDVIPIPKGFVKDIAYMLSVHGVSLEELNKEIINDDEAETEAEVVADIVSEVKVQITETSFED
jgi:hypothetical protein